MDKNEMQDKELDQVAGGFVTTPIYGVCTACNEHYAMNINYPQGFFVRTESSGCSSSTSYYKCPNCGREWKN